jgi:hypothetical protein
MTEPKCGASIRMELVGAEPGVVDMMLGAPLELVLEDPDRMQEGRIFVPEPAPEEGDR